MATLYGVIAIKLDNGKSFRFKINKDKDNVIVTSDLEKLAYVKSFDVYAWLPASLKEVKGIQELSYCVRYYKKEVYQNDH